MNEIVWPTIDSKHLIVDSKQMLIVEKEMFSDGMPQEALMEKAGIQISRWLLKKKPLLKNGITVFVGPGHNGGDGAVIARELFLKGFYVQVWCPFPIKKRLTNNHLNYLTSIGVTKLVEPPDANGKDLWIDAVFGNNQTRKVDDKLIEYFYDNTSIIENFNTFLEQYYVLSLARQTRLLGRWRKLLSINNDNQYLNYLKITKSRTIATLNNIKNHELRSIYEKYL